MNNVIQLAKVQSNESGTEVRGNTPYIGNQSFEDRNAALKAMVMMAGIRLPQTRLPEGHSLWDIGEENKRAMQSEVKALPDLHDGLSVLVGRIQAEDAKDVPVPLHAVRMTSENAGLYGVGSDPKKALAYTKSGFSHVAQFIRPSTIQNGFVENMLALPNELRAQVFNHWANTHVGKTNEKHIIRTIIEPASKRRVIRAVTSGMHSLQTGDDLTIAGVLAAMPKGAKLRVTRTLDRTDFEIIWPAMERQLVVGDVALIALTITNSETKGTSLRIEPKLLRVLCANFTTAYSDGADEEVSLKHVGDLSKKLPAAIERARKVVEPFVEAFGDAYADTMPRPRAEVLEMLGRKFKGQLAETTLTRAAELWDADGVKSAGDTLAGLVNALTRASQEQTMAAAAETERIAGKLVMGGWAAALA